MTSNIALIIIISLTFGISIATFLMLRSFRKQMWGIDSALMALSSVLESQADSFKILDEMDAQNKEALEHIIKRQEYQIVLSKYVLAGVRLNFVAHKNACVEHEDYENAAKLEAVIHQIDEFLSAE